MDSSGKESSCLNPVPFTLLSCKLEEQCSGLGRGIDHLTKETSEELCFQFSDAFLKAGCCALATWSKCFVFHSFRTYLLLLCFCLCVVSCSMVIPMHLPYSVLIFCILPSCCVTATFMHLPSAPNCTAWDATSSFDVLH